MMLARPPMGAATRRPHQFAIFTIATPSTCSDSILVNKTRTCWRNLKADRGSGDAHLSTDFSWARIVSVIPSDDRLKGH
jgi:hypothetical protein